MAVAKASSGAKSLRAAASVLQHCHVTVTDRRLQVTHVPRTDHQTVDGRARRRHERADDRRVRVLEPPSRAARTPQFVEYADCMRSHGVPNFPDPSGGGGINIAGTGINPQAPSFKAARASCTKLLPGGGPGGRHATEQQKTEMVDTAECMRRHGITDFPDPTTTPPSSPAGYSSIEDDGGLVLAIPDAINEDSPAFKQAAAACQFSG